MNSYSTLLMLSLSIAIGSLRFPVKVMAQQDVTVSFPEIYPTSVSYLISNLPDILMNLECIIEDQETQLPLECNVETCLCSSGVVGGLTENRQYTLAFKTIDGNLPVAQESVKTASIGNISTSFRIVSIGYNISYNEDSVVPSSCETTLYTANQPEDSFTGTSENFCQYANFVGLTNDTEYILIVTSNGVINHNMTVRTGFFNFEVLDRGLHSLQFNTENNILLDSLIICNYEDLNTGEPILCPGNACYCSGDVFTGLSVSTTYIFQIKYEGEFLAVHSFTTASTTISIEVTFEPMNTIFTPIYPDGAYKPSTCGICERISNSFTPDECIIRGSENRNSQWCTQVVITDLTQDRNVDFTLYDSRADIVGELNQTRILKTRVNQTEIQLTSARYLLDTELAYNPELPCQFFYSDDRVPMNCLENDSETTDCPCDSGKLISLPSERVFDEIQVYQQNSYIAYTQRFQTASAGQFRMTNIGVNDASYSIQYNNLDSLPPEFCYSCIVPTSDFQNTCDKVEVNEGPLACYQMTFINLQTKSNYSILVLDGDGVIHNSFNFETSDFPISASFTTGEGLLNYNLEYDSVNQIPTRCYVYFEEDPFYNLQCQIPGCTCLSGSVILPTDNDSLKTIVISDGFGRTLANSSNNNNKLSVGAIIGIVIAVIVVIIIVITVTVVLLKKK